jgi:hypothetical protein
MTNCQFTNAVKKPGSPGVRLIAAAIFLGILCAFVLLWLGEKGFIQYSYIFGVCGFKQRYGLPCPGCGWTHAAQAFATGDIVRSFQTQPAAAVFCGVAILTAILSLHTVIFGLHSKLRIMVSDKRFWKYVLISSCIVVLLGWLVTFVKALSGREGS